MKKHKVLLIAYNNLGKGGIQNQLMGIVRSLHNQVDFDVVIWDNKRDYYRAEMEEYANVIECFRDIGSNIVRQKLDAFIRYTDIKKTIAGVIKKHGPYDVIHCNNAFDAAPCLEAAYDSGIPVRISHAHNTENPNLSKKFVYPAYKRLYDSQRKKIQKYATHFIGCSKQVTDYFFGKKLGQVIHVGVDLPDFNEHKSQVVGSQKTELLHVGNMSEQKNQLFTIEVMEELVKLTSNVHLTFIGGGTSYLENVVASISKKNLQDYIDIKPPETDVFQAMRESKLFVFPSTFEGFGIVLIEAQAMGLECIVSDIVSNEADCGGLHYVSLEKGPQYWAEFLYNKIVSLGIERKIYDVSEFSVNNMANRVYEVYKGE